MANPLLRGLARTAPRTATGIPEIDEPTPPSLLRKLGKASLSGISAVGNLLDVPGSMIRDVATLNNPLDQLLSPFSDENRTSGREMLRQYGLAGKKDNWGNWAAGLGVEIATDPLSYLTLGAGALSKAGQATKAAGLFDDATRVAAKVARVPSGKIGRTAARMTVTPAQLVQHGAPGALEKITTAASKQGLKYADIADEPLGGLMGIGLPFSKPSKLIGQASSPRAMQIAEGLDKFGETLRFGKIPGTKFAPGNALMRLFDAPTKDATNAVEAATGRQLFQSQNAARADVRKLIAPLATEFDDMAKAGAKIADPDLFRQALELPNVRSTLPAAEQAFVSKVRQTLDTIPTDAKEWGINLERYIDPQAEYMPRFITEGLRKDGGRGGMPFSAFFSSRKGRLDFLHGIIGGTDTIKKIIKDPQLEQMLNAGATRKQVRKFLMGKWAREVPPEFLTRTQRQAVAKQMKSLKIPGRPDVAIAKTLGVKPKNTFQAMATWAGKLSPETRQTGVFGNHPLADLMHGLVGYHDARASAETVLQTLAQKGMLQPLSKAAQQRNLVTLPKLLQKLGMNLGDDSGGAAAKLAQIAGIPVSKKLIKGYRKMGVDKGLAQYLVRINKGFDGPEVANEIVGVLDSVTNLFKGGVTSPWPGFQVRNLLSGQFNNWIAGQFSARSVQAANKLVRGQTIEGASQIPAVQKLAQEQGIAQLSDDVATKLLGQLAYAHKITGKYEGQAVSVSGKTAAMQGGALGDILGEIPGHNPLGLRGVGQKLLGRQGATWNPLQATARGVGGQMESTFAPLAAGEEAGHYVESLNRLSPFIDLLQKGVDPAEAAQRVGAAQVQYANRYYTPFERQVLGRVFPFFKFTRGQLPFTLEKLAQHPGGKLAQTVRAVDSARGQDEVTPDYVAETASIPLGTLPDGSKRYITGFGLPFEDPLKLLPNPGFDLLNRANPMIKLPLEMATGRSLFQPDRELSDMDPTVGRILANVGKMTGLRKSNAAVRIPGGDVLEPILANSPLSKVFTSLRTATDDRKGLAGRALNLGTGVRVTDISPAAQDAVLRERAQDLEKSLGARQFEKTWMPDEAQAKMSEAEKREWQQLEALKKILEARAKGRRK